MFIFSIQNEKSFKSIELEKISYKNFMFYIIGCFAVYYKEK